MSSLFAREVETKTSNSKKKKKKMQLGGKEAVPGEESFNNYIDNKKLPSSTSPETQDITLEDRDRALSKRHARGAATKARLNSKMRVTAEPIRSTGEKRVEKTPQKVEEKERGREGARGGESRGGALWKIPHPNRQTHL